MKNWIFLFAAASLLFSGCMEDEAFLPTDEFDTVKPTYKTTGIGEEIILHINETVMIVPDGFTITFMDVPEDSRCPEGANCIWQGRAVMTMVFKNREVSYEAFFETPNPRDEHGQAVNVFGRTVKLVSLAPYPSYDTPISLEQYRIAIVVDDLEDFGNGK